MTDSFREMQFYFALVYYQILSMVIQLFFFKFLDPFVYSLLKVLLSFPQRKLYLLLFFLITKV